MFKISKEKLICIFTVNNKSFTIVVYMKTKEQKKRAQFEVLAVSVFMTQN